MEQDAHRIDDVRHSGLTRRTALVGALGAAGAGLSTAPPASATTAGLYDKIYAIDKSTTGGLSVAVYDRRSMSMWQYNAPFRNEGASIIKILVAASVCYRAQSAGRALTTSEKSQMSSMIRYSDNATAIQLVNAIGGPPVLQTMANHLGMTATRVQPHWGLTTTSAYDQLLLLNEICWHGRVLSPTYRTYILGLMGQVTSGQRWGAGAYGSTQVKNGWLQYNGVWRINSIGHVTGGGRNHTLATLERGTPTMAVGTSVANRVASTVYTHLAAPL